jgi:ABC-type Fe3+ transport system permease subunit
MSKRLKYRFVLAGAAAVLLTLCIDLLSSASAVGGQRAIDEMTSTHVFLFRTTIHAITELAPAVPGLLAAAGLILLVVRMINRRHDPQTAKRPSAARE